MIATAAHAGPLTYATFALLAAFGAVDAAAHFTHYRYGETFSAATWVIERHKPLARLTVALGCLLLLLHLTIHA